MRPEVLEILSHLKSSGALVPEGESYQLVRPLDDDMMPASLQDLVNLRLGKLDEDQREVLEGAAVLGYVFEASLLASLDYVRLLWATLFGFLVFGHFPGAPTWTGAAIVVAAAIFTIYRESRRNRGGVFGQPLARIGPVRGRAFGSADLLSGRGASGVDGASRLLSAGPPGRPQVGGIEAVGKARVDGRQHPCRLLGIVSTCRHLGQGQRAAQLQ